MQRSQKICAFIEAYRIIPKDIKVVRPTRYVREPDGITAACRVTTRIRSSTRVVQALLWMALEVAERSGLVTVHDGGNSLD